MHSTQLREQFIAYFHAHGHTHVGSSPLSLAGDPTLLFTNAGMVPFKDIFLGSQKATYRRAVTCQKCLRVSGKHNDLEEVGKTKRHHTFFEMLGNFSFGDYFKATAIELAWHYLTKNLALNPQHLWVTVFAGDEGFPEDTESRRLWQKISTLPAERMVGRGRKDNFWAMGELGPCGPCSEIYVDLQPDAGAVVADDFDNGRCLEIWNLVFMQLNRQQDGTVKSLPAPCVDTGMGLERLTAVMQGVDSNYHTDLFMPLLQYLADRAKIPYQCSQSATDVAMRVIADHARAASLLMAEGHLPSNEGPGYVLRRLMRRAIRFGAQLRLPAPFLGETCCQVVKSLGPVYEELVQRQAHIQLVAEQEEENFLRTLQTGLQLFAQAKAQALATSAPRPPAIAGELVFRLYDTYGFPKDLTLQMAAEAGLQVDEAGFTAAMAQQQQRSRDLAGKGHADWSLWSDVAAQLGKQTFVGDVRLDEVGENDPDIGRFYWSDGQDSTLSGDGIMWRCQVAALVSPATKHAQPQLPADAPALVVLQPNPFYGESGGQKGDSGVLLDSQRRLVGKVVDTQKPHAQLCVADVQLQQSLAVGQTVWAVVFAARRETIRAHHSATHLLHHALRSVLGPHVAQAGSLVSAETLRFDFTHPKALSMAQIAQVEALVNEWIAANAPVKIVSMPKDEAKALGAMALFGEKYGDVVRVVRMGESIELCGGTHVRQTAAIGGLIVCSEEAVQSGVRRIHAKAHHALRLALQQLQQGLNDCLALLQQMSPSSLQGNEHSLTMGLARLLETYQRHRRDLGLPEQAFLSPQDVPKHPLWWQATLDNFDPDYFSRLWRYGQRVQQALAQPSLSESSDEQQGMLLVWLHQLRQALHAQSLQLEQQQAQRLAVQAQQLLAESYTLPGEPPLQVVAAEVVAMSSLNLQQLSDALRALAPASVMALIGVAENKLSVVVAKGTQAPASLHAGMLLKALLPLLGAKGGGRADFAKGGVQLTEQPTSLKTSIGRALEKFRHLLQCS